MFGVGPSEFVMVFLLVLLLFGPSKLPQMARDIGRFVGEARRSIDEFKDELTSAGEEEEENKTSHRQRRKNSPAKKEDEPAETANGEGSTEANSVKEEEYDF
ncbi:MAG: twin-arginine translocase TatA/TatE family subunit [Rubrobacteraceae bacterium]